MLAYTRDGDKVTISWGTGITGFTLEMTDTLSNAAWSPVPQVLNNSVTITLGTGNRFFRLKKA